MAADRPGSRVGTPFTATLWTETDVWACGRKTNRRRFRLTSGRECAYNVHMLRRTTIYLDAKDMKRLERLAREDGTKAAYLVRKAIREYLERQESTRK